MSKKIRIFAGPNGSGKTSLFNRIRDYYGYNTGIFVNADHIDFELKTHAKLCLDLFNIQSSLREIKSVVSKSSLSKRIKIDFNNTFSFNDNVIELKTDNYPNSYIAALLCEFVRHKFLNLDRTFSTETVMSDPSKIELIKKANSKGFKTYLYYITTDDVRINIERVKSRVQAGGHDVPEKKIRDRYKRSLDLLLEAAKNCNKVFLIDSTELPSRLIAEISEGNVTIKTEKLPNWYIKNFENKIFKN